jgi:DNA-binding CsgD family transcriptional regulator
MYYSNYKILQNKYSEALSYLEKAKFYAKKSDNSVLLLKIYESYYEIYKKKHDAINEQKYLIQYLELKDSIEVANKYGIKKSLQNLINKNAETKKALINKNIYLKILSFFTICIVILFIYYHKKTVAVWKKMEQRLLFKKNKIKTLEKQNNSSFEEIINLAKKNHPNFYTRFQEIYPDFQRKILEINPTLQNSELVLLAYIYLNFETKEIADYLFKSPKTIQNRKHNLRKKLQISSSEDIYVWLKTL